MADLSPVALSAAAGIDPWALVARLATGRPGEVEAVALRLRRAGREADETTRLAEGADRTTAASFRNDGVAVFDGPASTAWTARALGRRGERLEQTARDLIEVAAALRTHQAASRNLVAALEATLQRLVAARNAALAGRPTTPEAAAADRRYAQLAVDDVRRTGGRVQAELDDYQALLRSRTARLAELGPQPTPVGPRHRPVDTSALAPNPLLDGRLEGATSVPAPPIGGPLINVPAPAPAGPQINVVPPALGGPAINVPAPRLPGPAITVPATGLGAGRQDGPGTAPLVGGPGVHVDAAKPDGRKSSGSINQGQQKIQRGKAPPGITRIDRGRIPGEKPHVHFADGGALNQDGTWKHLPEHRITKDQKTFLEEYGWTIPD